MSIKEVIRQLQQAGAHMERVSAMLAQAAVELEQAQQLIAESLSGASEEPALAAAAQARAWVCEASRGVAETATATDEAIGRLLGAGRPGKR